MIPESEQTNQKSHKQSRNEGSYIQFTFPKSKQGIQYVESKKLLNKILRDMFYVEFTSKGSPLPYPYDIVKKPLVRSVTETRAMSFTVKCKICTNFMEYSKKLDGQSMMYKLQTFYSQHDHRLDQQRKVGYSHEKVALDYRTAKQKRIFLNLNRYSSSTEDIEKCIAELPINLTKNIRETLICKKFNISINEFKNIYLKLNSRKEIQFADFIEDLQKKGYDYRYLPENLLKDNPKFSRKYQPTTFFSSNMPTQDKEMPTMIPRIDVDAKKNSNPFQDPKDKKKKTHSGTNQPFAVNPQPNIAQQAKGLNENNANVPLYKLSPHMVDPNNPNLPNVMLIVSPSMRQMYKKYGQFMGFDLTFSLIRQQPTHTQKQYLVGVFASKNESLRIIIFGFVVTNNQSAEVYKWLFKSFMEIMGKHPQTIITDEEVAIGKAIRELKEQGFYHGHHLLDTFHVLTKFRKAVEAETFQYLRRMIHAKDKFEYKRLFNETISQLSSDDEIKVLQDFDYHCQKYCYAHIPPTFVGFGVSDAMNQSFHNILKDKIPYEIKYLKACNIILPFLEQRNEIGTLSLICEIPYEEKFKFEFLKPYRKILSDRIFQYLIIECSKAVTHSLVLSDERYEKGDVHKIEEEGSENKKKGYEGHYELNKALDKDKFQIVTKQGICLVWKQKIPAITSSINQQQVTCDPSSNYWSQYSQKSTYTTNTYPYSQSEPQFTTNQYKWRCICQMEEKAGLCCSHILKLLVLKNESLLPYIHPRWFVMEENIYQGLGSFIKNDSNIKFVHNVTSDLSNLNRLKSVKLRGQYINARKTIKKQLEGIVEENLQPQPSSVPEEVRKRQKLLSSIRNKPTPEETSSYPMNAAYLEWVSANDDTIKKEKQKYMKVLQKKRKKELRRIRIEGGYIPKLNPSEKGQLSKSQYVDYVYLKPNEIREIEMKQKQRSEGKQLKKTLRLSERRRLKSTDKNKNTHQEDEIHDQLRERVELIVDERMGNNQNELNENMAEEQMAGEDLSLQSNNQNSEEKSQQSYELQEEQPQKEIINEIQQMLDQEDQNLPSDQVSSSHQPSQSRNRLDQDIQKLIQCEKLEEGKKLKNIEKYSHILDEQREQQISNHHSNTQLDDDGIEDKLAKGYEKKKFQRSYVTDQLFQLNQHQNYDHQSQQTIKRIYNPFNKLYKKKLIENDDIVPTEKIKNQNQKDSDDDFNPNKSKKKVTQRKEGGKKRGRPRIHPIKEPSEKPEQGKRPRGRPRLTNGQIRSVNLGKNINEQEMEAYYNFYGFRERQEDENEGSQQEDELWNEAD